MSFNFAKKFATVIFIGKLNYAAELWGGGPPRICTKKYKLSSWRLQGWSSDQNPLDGQKNNSSEKLDWMSVDETLAYTANKLTYKIFHMGKPELLNHRLMKVRPPTTNNTRLSGPYKLGPRPTSVGRTNITKNQYRSKSYEYYEQIPHEIQKLSKISHFSKWLKKKYKYGATQPSDYLPRFDDQKLRKNE